MQKIARLVLALITIPIITSLAFSATGYIGQIVQKVDGSAVTQPVSGTVTANIPGSTVAVVNQAGQDLDVNVTNASIPVSQSGAWSVSPGTGTYPVAGTVSAIQSGTWNVNAVQSGNWSVSPGTGTYPVSGSVTVTNTSFAVTGGTVAVVGLAGAPIIVIGPYISAPVISTAAVTGTSKQLLAANATRKGVECETRCTNTVRVFINFGASAATSDHKPIEACSSWQPPYGISVTAAIQVIAASGTQDVVCVEY